MIDAPVAFDSRRKDLAAFLRARRSNVRPSDVGFSPTIRRHVPGLRREEVAALAGISTTWYTWIEQARPINISDDVLDRIGSALQLRVDEIEFVRYLLREDPQRCTLTPWVPPVLRALIESHEQAPAYVATPRLDLLVWNPFVGEIFDYSETSDPLARNLLWRMFYDPARRELYSDWPTVAAIATANFRAIYARYRGDVHFEDLLGIMLENRDFERVWKRWDVASKMPPFTIRHAKIGLCEVTPVQATLDIAPGCYLALYSCVQRS